MDRCGASGDVGITAEAAGETCMELTDDGGAAGEGAVSFLPAQPTRSTRNASMHFFIASNSLIFTMKPAHSIIKKAHFN
jgi:hypothetical protein